MSIQSDLQTVTEAIVAARAALAEVETDRLERRFKLTQAETELAVARVALMARNDAGTNDAARRAYADRETRVERDAVDRLAYSLMEADAAHIDAAAELQMLIDRRRLLETLVTLGANSAIDLAIHAAYADNGDGRREPVYDEDGNELPF